MSDRMNATNRSGGSNPNRRPLRQSDACKRYRKRRVVAPDNTGTLRLLVQQSMGELQEQLKNLVTTTVKETLSAMHATHPAEPLPPPPPTTIYLPPAPDPIAAPDSIAAPEPITTPSTVWLEDVALKQESEADFKSTDVHFADASNDVSRTSNRESQTKRRKTIGCELLEPQHQEAEPGASTSNRRTSRMRKEPLRRLNDAYSSASSASSKASSDGTASPRHEWSDEFENKDAESDDQDDNDVKHKLGDSDPFLEEHSSSKDTTKRKSRHQRKSTAKQNMEDNSDSEDDHASSHRDDKPSINKKRIYMPYHFTPGARLGSQLVYSTDEKQLYRLHMTKGGLKNYACVLESCKARVSISGRHLFRTKRFVAHNHGDQELKMQKYAFENILKTECQQTGAVPSQVYRRLLEKFPEIGKHSSLEKMSRNLNRLADEKSTRKRLIADPDEQLPYEFVPGLRRGAQMLYTTGEKQLYHKRHSFEDRTRYACAVKTCSASIFLIGDLLRRPDKYRPHNHGDQEHTMLEWKQQAVVLNEKDQKMIEKFTRNGGQTLVNPTPADQGSPDQTKAPKTIAFASTDHADLQEPNDPVNAQQSDESATANGAAADDKSASLPYFYTPGGRLGSKLLYSVAEKQLYRLHTSRNDRKFFACAAPFCKARLNMDVDVLTRVKKFVAHNHGDQEHKLRKYTFDTACKMECQQSGASPQVVYQRVLEKFPSTGDQHTPLSKLSRNLNRLAGIVHPRHRKVHPRSAQLDVNEVLPYHFTSGAHINSTLLYSSSDKQLYRLHRNTPDRKRYTCHVDGCPAAVFLDTDGALRRAPGRALHTEHGDQDQVALKIGFKVACRQECRQHGAKPMEAYQKMLKKFPLTGQQVNFKDVRRQLTRLRSQATSKHTDEAIDAAQDSVAQAASEQPVATDDGGNALENLLNAADADVPRELSYGQQLIGLQVDAIDVEELLTADAIPVKPE